MIPRATLAFTGFLHEQLRTHLLTKDGLEAAAILLCARSPGPRLRLLAREAVLVPHRDCHRSRDSLTWPGKWIEEALDRAESEELILILIHSHPGGFFDFSPADDESDRRVMPGLFQAVGDLHGSAIMTGDGAIRGRLYEADLNPRPIDLVTVAGHDLNYWWAMDAVGVGALKRPVAFTSDMTRGLGRLSATLIGASGTGSIVGEQLARLGFRNIRPVEFDRVERRNLNRILHSTFRDATARRLKVEVFADAVGDYRGAGVVEPVAASILTREAVLAASQSDVLFCCVDSLEARQIADLISAAFLLPLFDVGVVIPARKSGENVAIADVCGRIDYVQPGRSTLFDRGVYTAESLRAEYLRRVAPEAYDQELQEGYLKGLPEEAPAVITLNMRAASACVNEFIARAYPFRLEPNNLYARTRFSLAACEEEFTPEDAFQTSQNPILARGSQEPLLGLPALTQQRDDEPYSLVA